MPSSASASSIWLVGTTGASVAANKTAKAPFRMRPKRGRRVREGRKGSTGGGVTADDTSAWARYFQRSSLIGVPFVQRRAPAAAERPRCIDIQKRIGVIIVLHKIIPAFFRPTDLRGTVFLAFYEKASVSGTKKRMEKAGAPKASLRCSSENRPPMHKAAHPR